MDPLSAVHLVGAGPGDPGLLTVRAKQRIEEARVVVCDLSALKALGEVLPTLTSGELIDVGGGDHGSVPDLLADRYRAGERVVRLYAGDPFTLGGGAREAAALRDAGIPFDVTPAIPTAVAAAAFAGVPLGAEGTPSGVSLRGREAGTQGPEGTEGTEERKGTEDGGGTASVALTGPGPWLREGGARLLAEGWSPETPTALVEGTGATERRTRTGTLGEVAEGELESSEASTVAVVGESVRLRGGLRWIEDRPLFDRTVVVTRPRARAGALRDALRELGARVVELPAIRIVPPRDGAPLLRALERLETYDWVVFTSVNGVRAVAAALGELGRDARAFSRVSVAAIGPSTAGELRTLGLTADVVPEEYRAEGLVEELLEASSGEEGTRFLLPRAAEARETLPEGLRRAGGEVDEVAAYRAAPGPEEEADAVADRLRRGEVDWITFTASSTVRNFVRLVGREVGGARVAAIGPITAATASEEGLPADVVAEEYTVPGLVRALVEAELGTGDRPEGRRVE